jgi:hypothetical protein
MNRLELVELIEDQAAKLSPEGRDIAERMGPLAEAPPGGRASTYATQSAQADEARDLLPTRDRNILEGLQLLWEGLADSDAAERGGQSGERYRERAVIGAAWNKDRGEGRMIDPDMTPERAAARLREPG